MLRSELLRMLDSANLEDKIASPHGRMRAYDLRMYEGDPVELARWAGLEVIDDAEYLEYQSLKAVAKDLDKRAREAAERWHQKTGR
jgi:hypothetical protein